jgi:hypothetical protein
MAKRKNYRAGQGGFVVPPQGRPPQGGLPGESKEDRDKRVRAFIRENPKLDAEGVARAMKVPLKCVKREAHAVKVLAQEEADKATAPAQFLPQQLFTPGPPLPPTPQARLDAVPDDVKADIAARYGAIFKRRS